MFNKLFSITNAQLIERLYNTMNHFTILHDENICASITSESYLNVNLIINIVPEHACSIIPPPIKIVSYFCTSTMNR